MELGLDVADIAKTLGGFMAFVVVLYIGVLFYKKEASFSDEYTLLLKQYKERNEALQDELDEQREKYDRLISDNKLKIDKLEEITAELRRELAYVRNLVGQQAFKP